MTDVSPPQEVFGIIPPPGAVRVRIQSYFARKGNTPVIDSSTIEQTALQTAIDSSDSLRRYVEKLSPAERPAGPPYELDGDVLFYGADGGAIDRPQRIKFGFNPIQAGNAELTPREVLCFAERLVTATLSANSAEHRANAEALARGMEALGKGHQANAEALAKAHAATTDGLKATMQPIDKFTDKVVGITDRERADRVDATEGLMKLLMMQHQIPQAQPEQPKKSMMEQAKEFASFIGTVKGLLPN